MKPINVTPWPSCGRSAYYLEVIGMQLLMPDEEAAYLSDKSYEQIDYYHRRREHLIILGNFHLQYLKDNKCEES